MHRIPANIFVEREATLDFMGDDGKRILFERMIAYVQFPNERLPIRFFLNRLMPVGDYKGFLIIDASKDKLIVSVDYDTMVLEKLAPAPSTASPSTSGKA